MERKLTAQGPNKRKSYTITLPLWWVKENNLDKSRIVNLEVIGDKAVIHSGKEIQDIVVLKGEKYHNSIIKVLQGLYRLGCNELKIYYKDGAQLEKITSAIHKKLIGYEIIEQNKSYCFVKDITGSLEEKFDVVLRRVFLLILESLEAKDSFEIDSFDSNISRLTNYCQRLLVKKGHLDYRKVPIYYLVIDQLEKLKDEISWINSIKNISNSDKKYVSQIKIFVKQLYQIYCKFDSDLFEKLVTETYLIRKEITSKKELNLVKMHTHNISRLINSISTNIGVLKHQ